MKIAFVYGGQGSQVVAMGKDYYHNENYAQEFYDCLELDTDVKEYAFEASLTEITKTNITQIIIVAYQVMVTDLLKRAGVMPKATLGLSIGEYSALYAAGILNQKDTLKSAEMRGRYMAEVDADTAMYAVLKADESEIDSALQSANDGRTSHAYIANYNCPGQIVISGDRTACEKATEILAQSNKKAIKLNVSTAFHTPFMDEAAKKFSSFLEQIDFRKADIPLYCNLSGEEQTITADIMVEQMRNPVKLENGLRNLIDSGVNTIIEIGYNNTLKNFIKRIDRKVKVLTISDYQSYREVIGEIKNAS